MSFRFALSGIKENSTSFLGRPSDEELQDLDNLVKRKRQIFRKARGAKARIGEVDDDIGLPALFRSSSEFARVEDLEKLRNVVPIHRQKPVGGWRI